MRLSVRTALAVVAVATTVRAARAQVGVGASITPYAGYLVTGHWFDGPVGTSISSSNQPMVGAQANIPLSRGVALVSNVAYSSGDLRVGLPLIGGVNVGSSNSWMYDAALELGGLSGRKIGIAPFIAGGVGGMTNDVKVALFNARATNLAYTGAIGVDIGLTPGFGLRVQAKDWVSRFNTEQAVGFRTNGNLAHNWALTGGAKISF